MNLAKKLLVVAVASAAFAACKNDPATSQDANTAPAATAEANEDNTVDSAAVAQDYPEIVYINSDSLLSNYQYFKDAKARLETKGKRLERDLRAKADAFQKEVGQYQQSAAGLTQEQRATTEQRLAQKQQQLGTQQQSASTQLATEENEEMKKIYDKVEAYLKKLSEERGYKMVLTYSRGNSAILYSDKSLDITEFVIDGLNEEYKKDKPAAKK